MWFYGRPDFKTFPILELNFHRIRFKVKFHDYEHLRLQAEIFFTPAFPVAFSGLENDYSLYNI